MSSLLRKKFDSSKCKTLLQLSSQRLKVLRNRQALAVKKARVDVAKLLEKGQDSNAKMQVESVFREERIVALYDLLDQFCHIVINGLDSIKSQKECPLDLREAVASLIFAAPKCADLEELKKVSKHLTSKYGTEFSVAAKELRPDCGVNRQVIQSLSSHPLQFDARLKLLKEIAVENNINWDYEKATADVSKGTTDLIDGPNHFASASELSQVMHVNEFKAQGSAVLQNAIGSRTLSASNSLGLPLHDVHQFAKINTNTAAMGTSRAQMASEGVVSDPYALARADGKMDYKEISDYIRRAPSMELKQESRGDVAYGKPAVQLPEREQGHNGLLDASHREDALQKSKGKKAKKRHVHRRNEEEELLDLKNAAEYALASATHAAEAARAAVDLVRMESLERSKGSKVVITNTKLQEMQSKSSSGSVQNENHKLAGVDYDGYAHRERFFCEEGQMEPNQNNGRVGDQVPEMNTGSTLDASEDSLKYVVFEQISGSQRYTHSSTQAEEYNTNTESYAFPEVRSEPTMYSHKYSDRIIFDSEHEEAGLKEVSTDALSDNIFSNNIKEQELDKKASFRNNHERNYHHTEGHRDKYVQNDLSVPQFDDSSSEEDDYVQKDLSVPEFKDQNSEEANDEEEPFYLRGRAAVASEDYADGHAGAPHSKANMSTSMFSFSTDDKVEEESSSSKQEASLSLDLHVEPLGISNDKERLFIMGNSPGQNDVDEASPKSSFDDYVEPVSLPTQSSKTPFRCQISTESTSESSIMSPVAYNHSSGKPTTPRKLKWQSSISEDWDLDPSYYELASPRASVKLSSLNENRERSSRVNRKLSWFSGASEDSESMSERSFESHKLDWNPSSVEDLNLGSLKPSLGMQNSTKMDAIQVTQPSTPKSYYGVSKRSVRSNRSRQTQDVSSLSSGNEDIRNPVR